MGLGGGGGGGGAIGGGGRGDMFCLLYLSQNGARIIILF